MCGGGRKGGEGGGEGRENEEGGISILDQTRNI